MSAEDIQVIYEEEDPSMVSLRNTVTNLGNSFAGAIVRRVIAICTLFAVIFAPFILAFFNEPVTIEANKGSGLLHMFIGDMFSKGNGWIELNGYVLLPEVRQTMLALVGFYFGSSQVK